MRSQRLRDRPVVIRELLPPDIKLDIEQLTQTEAMEVARYLAQVVGNAHARQMDHSTRASWLKVLRRNRSKTIDAPPWLWNSIVDLVGSYMSLRRQGRNYVGLCPWHDDTKPSLQINQERQTFKCWVCNLGGDIFSFLMQKEGVEFREALTMLAERESYIRIYARGRLDGSLKNILGPLRISLNAISKFGCLLSLFVTEFRKCGLQKIATNDRALRAGGDPTILP